MTEKVAVSVYFKISYHILEWVWYATVITCSLVWLTEKTCKMWCCVA